MRKRCNKILWENGIATWHIYTAKLSIIDKKMRQGLFPQSTYYFMMVLLISCISFDSWPKICTAVRLWNLEKNTQSYKILTKQSAPMASAIFSEDLGIASSAICIILCMIKIKIIIIIIIIASRSTLNFFKIGAERY